MPCPTASARATNSFATMYRTLHDLSCTEARSVSSKCCFVSASFNPDAIAIRSGIVNNRTESWSSEASLRYSGMMSLMTLSFCCTDAIDLANG